ncbi:hypothetical protein EYF80_004999 [Liparis tanakae]|uniref:Uncharacterized protein n=1 Tax=Liparis tanakae TaxID=230148 RepID=A0A4Z2J4Y5_9TELE|nr:hypothetical protein EYF80_004999 [Liparis tanakae]
METQRTQSLLSTPLLDLHGLGGCRFWCNRTPGPGSTGTTSVTLEQAHKDTSGWTMACKPIRGKEQRGVLSRRRAEP